MTYVSLFDILFANGYRDLRTLPDGRVIGTGRMAFTTGLFLGLDRYGYECRYCYELPSDARKAAQTWDGQGDPPGPWIKQKGLSTGERLGPGAIA